MFLEREIGNMIRFGIMGAGVISHKFADAISKTEDATLQGVASKSYERAVNWAKDHRVSAYGSYEEMLSDDQVDVVYIATTNNYHFDNIMMCLDAGKNVICEKPIVLSANHMEQIIQKAKDKNLFLMEAMWTRLLPKSAKIREWISQDRIGEPKLMQATVGWVADPVYNKRIFMSELEGGSLYDLGVYPIELLPYYVDQKVVGVQKMVNYHESGVDDLLNINLELETAYANFQCSFTTKLPEDAYIYGDKGYIKIPSIHMGFNAYLYDLNNTMIEAFEDTDTDNGFVYEVKEVVECLKVGKKESSVCPLSMSLQSAAIFDVIKDKK